ncbi:MAG: hypothetical protein ACKVJ7_01400 [Candidatus Poseidoniales archaeon]
MAKPYSSGHIGAVASTFTEMRMSGAVKDTLVGLLIAELDKKVPEMEDATLEANPEKKTLDDAQRTRLNYSRTRELMLERVSKVDSVGSEAVQAMVAHLEDNLSRLIKNAEKAAEKDRVNTIKPRHLPSSTTEEESTGSEESVHQPSEEDILEGQIEGNALTPVSLRRMARMFGGMPVTDAAVEELLLLYYDVVDQTEEDIRKHSQLGSSPAAFITAIGQMKDLMMLGWMRRMLKRAGADAKERGYKRIDIEQLVHLDPFD